MASRPMQSSSHNDDHGYTNPTTDGSSTPPTRCPQIWGEGERDDSEIMDLVEGDDEGDKDEVVETMEALSEPGKTPVCHHEIYDRLLDLMNKQGTYHFEPEHGINSKDLTSFHPDQCDWTEARDFRAPILTLWSKPPESTPTYPIGYLLFNGRLILDYAGKPIRAFRNLPLTISSAVKGFRIEAWIRQDFKRLRMSDILARMRTEMTCNGPVPIRGLQALRQRASNFRMKSGLVTFHRNIYNARGGRYLDSLRTSAQREKNQAIDRDLTDEELDIFHELGKRASENAVAPQSSSSAVVSTPVAASVFPCTTPLTSSAHRLSSATESTPAKPLTPATEPAPEPTPSDSREDVPKTREEVHILVEALVGTVYHFVKLTGHVPQLTNTLESYSDQWNALQAQFASMWKSQRPVEKTPILYKLAKWTGGISCCNYGWRTQVGGEERDGVDEDFAKYMDDAQEEWLFARDTLCNSHRNSTKDHLAGRHS